MGRTRLPGTGRPGDPFAVWRAASEVTVLALEAQAVIAMRAMGMAGLWSVSPGENARMVTEKLTAFPKAAMAAAKAAAAGEAPEAVVAAAAKPLGRVTRSNVRRLSRGGPARTPARKPRTRK